MTLTVIDQKGSLTVINDVVTVDAIVNEIQLIEVAQQGLRGAAGDRITRNADTNLSALKMVRFNPSNGRIAYADHTIEAHATHMAGFTTQAANSGVQVELLTHGYVSDGSWSWSGDQPLFLGAGGAIVQGLPSGGAFVLQVGRVISATEIFIDIGEPIFI